MFRHSISRFKTKKLEFRSKLCFVPLNLHVINIKSNKNDLTWIHFNCYFII